MKNTCFEDRIKVEQFTDDFIPEGVVKTPQEIVGLLDSFSREKSSEDYYVYIVPIPSKADIEFAEYINVNHPFQWINKGDYVATLTGIYSCVIPEKIFHKEYLKIALCP